MTGKDFSDGISKAIASIPELVMDRPNIHQVLFNYIIKPLLSGKPILEFGKVKWDYVIPPDDEDDEVLFEETNG